MLFSTFMSEKLPNACTMQTEQQIVAILKNHPEVLLGILFGSVAEREEDFESDLDIAVAGSAALGATEKENLIEQLAAVVSRPVDLIDLQLTSGTLLHQILTKGKLMYCEDDLLYARLINKMLFNQTDMMPYYYRILEERRRTWIVKSMQKLPNHCAGVFP
jgi:predicted nucleotidyltransferase